MITNVDPLPPVSLRVLAWCLEVVRMGKSGCYLGQTPLAPFV